MLVRMLVYQKWDLFFCVKSLTGLRLLRSSILVTKMQLLQIGSKSNMFQFGAWVYKNMVFFVCVITHMGLESFSDSWTFCSYCFKIAQIRICCSLGYINTGITTFTTVVNTPMGVQIYRSDNFLSKSFKKSCLNIVKNRLYFCLRSLISRQQAMKKQVDYSLSFGHTPIGSQSD